MGAEAGAGVGRRQRWRLEVGMADETGNATEMATKRGEIACDKDEGEAAEGQETPWGPDRDKDDGRRLAGAATGR